VSKTFRNTKKHATERSPTWVKRSLPASGHVHPLQSSSNKRSELISMVLICR